MKIHDRNPEQKHVVLLLHPMLANAQLMEDLIAAAMGEEYRYVIPDFSGHGDAAAETYESAAKEASQLRAYLQEQGICEVQLAFGASMGAIVLMELLRSPDISIRQLFFEGASMFEHADFLTVLLKRIMAAKHRKAKAHPELAVQKMSQLYGRQAGEIMAGEMLRISDESLRNIVRDCGHVRLPELTPEQQRACVFAYGEKDGDLKAAGNVCPRKYPQAKLMVWPGRGHCTHITEDPAAYAAMLYAYLHQNVGM